MRLSRHGIAGWACMLAITGSTAAADYFVDANIGTDANDGLAWATAKASVGAALVAASGTPEADIVSVAVGTYYETLVMPPDVSLLGSFPSGGGVQDINAHPSILDARWRGRVVDFGPGTDACVLSGFVVRNGIETDRQGGAGVRVLNAAPLIEGCVIEHCSASAGGGLSVGIEPAAPPRAPRIERCVIRANTVSYGGGAGAVIYVAPDGGVPLVVMRDCIVEGNVSREPSPRTATALWLIAGTGVELVVQNVTCRANADRGAFGDSPPSELGASFGFINCEFSNNELGGLLLTVLRPPRTLYYSLANCTFADNRGPDLAAFAVDPGPTPAYLDMQRCILAGGSGDLRDSGGFLTLSGWGVTADPISDNLVPGGIPLCPDNLDAVPVFASGPAGDYYLAQVAAGQSVDSPGVDASTSLATAVGMDALTTRTDTVADSGACDYGVHYAWGFSIFGDADGLLDVRRSTDPRVLPLVAQVTNLPWLDAPGVLSDSSQPLICYLVDFPDNAVHAEKNIATDSVRLRF